jgi:hypothetical protein
VPWPQQTCPPDGPHALALGQHAPLMHTVPEGQQLLPQIWVSAQHWPSTQSVPDGQQDVPHCDATLQQAP